jgi:hypothetical protein
MHILNSPHHIPNVEPAFWAEVDLENKALCMSLEVYLFSYEILRNLLFHHFVGTPAHMF